MIGCEGMSNPDPESESRRSVSTAAEVEAVGAEMDLVRAIPLPLPPLAV